MKYKTIALFLLSVVICAVAASYRFMDSAHSMGMLKIGGGAVRHPAILDKERGFHVLIATAGVAPPFRGNARVVLEGGRGLEATFHNAEPAVGLGFHHRPRFSGDTYYDLRPGDRIALWLRIRRTGWAEGRESRKEEGIEERQAPSTGCPQCADTKEGIGMSGKGGGVALAFYDTATNGRLLSMPIRFVEKGGDAHGRR